MTDGKLRHPTGLYILSFAEACDRISYYGIQAVLMLYVTKQFLFSDQQAYATFGLYSALGFATPVIGGYIADRYLGLRYAITLGTLLIAIGNFILIYPLPLPFYSGLACVVLGIGLLKGNASTQLGVCYKNNQTLRSGGFTLFYMAMNLGGILGPVLFGIGTATILGWKGGFIVSGACMLLASALYLIYRKYFGQHNNTPVLSKKPQLTQFLAVAAILCLLLMFIALFQHPNIFSNIIAIMAVAMVVGFIVSMCKMAGSERQRVIVFAAFCIFTIMVAAGEMQMGSSMMLYVSRAMQHTLFGFTIPVEFFASVEPFAVIVLAFVFSAASKRLGYENKTISAPFMVALGVLLSGLAFIVLSLSASIEFVDGVNVRMWLMIFGNVLLGAGELCAIPTIMAAIEFLAPKHLKSSFMGIYFLAFAFSGYLSGLMGKVGETLLKSTLLHMSQATYYRDFFGYIGVVTLVVACVAYALAKTLKKMMK